MEIVCTVTSLTATSQAADKTFILNATAFMTNALTIIQNAACNFPYTYTNAYTKDGTALGSSPSWLTFSTTQFTMAATAVADIGVYVITTTTTIPQIDPSTS